METEAKTAATPTDSASLAVLGGALGTAEADGPAGSVDPVALQWGRRFGEHLEATRARALLSRAQLAIKLGVDEDLIRRWEQGEQRPSPEFLARLIVVLARDGAQFSASPQPSKDLPGLARRLREERYQRGITQAQAGKLVGAAQATYAGWEIGRATPAAHYAVGIGAFLGIDPDDVSALAEVPFTVDTAQWPPLGQLLGARREVLRLTREQLAASVGVAESSIVAWELGYRRPRPPQVRQLAAALALDPSLLEAALPPRGPQLSSLGELIQSRQQRLGLRRRDIADRAGLDEVTLSRWAHGHHKPALGSLKRLAAALELPFEVVCRASGVEPAL